MRAWLAALVLVPSAAGADPAEILVETPGEVITVTSLRAPRVVTDEPAAVTVIDRRELEHSPLVLADDLLRAVPSVGTFRRSSSAIADPTSQGLSLRGVGPSAVSRALVLRDGVPANDPFGGWVYWRAISPLSIDRIEIAPSGASALFGNFALGGVVSVMSRPIDGASLDAVVATGSLGTTRGAVRATQRFGGVGIAIDGEALHSDGYTPIAERQRGAVDGDASSTHGTLGARVELARGVTSSHANAQYFQEALDAGTQFTTADVRALTYGAGTQVTTRAGVLRLELFGGVQRFEQTRARLAADRGSAAIASEQTTPSSDQGALATWSMTIARRHEVVVGVDARRVAGDATDALQPAMLGPMSLLQRTAGGEQRFFGAFAQDSITLGPVELSAAVRLDAWQDRDGATTLTFADESSTETREDDRAELQVDPRLGMLVHVSPITALRGSVYRSFRAPTLNELYRPFQVGTVLTAANADLGPESLWGAEAGPQVVLEGIVVRATAFWNRHRDAIANVTLADPLPNGATRQRQNLAETRVLGLELDASWRVTPAITAAIAHTFVDAQVTSAPRQPELVGKGLPQDPKLRTTATVTYDQARYATVTAQLRYLGRMFEDDLQTLPIGAVVLVDARIARVIGRGVSIFAAAQNIFDRRYLVGRAGVDTEGAPRTVELGVALHR